MAPKAPVPDFPLRLLTLLLFIPAFPFLLAHGIVAEYVLPALGLIPMSLSAVSGIAHLTGRVSKNSGWGCVADFWIAGFLIAILIPSWITMAEGYHYTRRDGLVAAYGTVPMMVAFCIHSYLTLRALWSFSWKPREKRCPHCDGDLRTKTTKEGKGYGKISMRDEEEGRASRRFEDDADDGDDGIEERPSTDDETAKLIYK